MKTVLFQGDSITDFYRRAEDNRILGSGYQTMVAGEIGYKFPNEYTFLNRGISGNRVIDILCRSKTDIIALKPDYLSILVGVNDVWHGFSYNNGLSDEEYEMYYDILISQIKQALPQIKIMIMEPFVENGSATEKRYDDFREQVEAKAACAKRVADKHNLVFVPLQKAFDDALLKAPSEFWLMDGVHPDAPGHNIIKLEWLKGFEKLRSFD